MLDEELKQEAIKNKVQNRNRFVIVLALFVVVLLILIVIQKNSDEEKPHPLQTIQAENNIVGEGSTVIKENAQREIFKKKLSYFETLFDEIKGNNGLYHWQPQNIKDLVNIKESALLAFSENRYISATEEIEKGIVLEKKLKIDWNQAYENKLKQATSFFSNQDAIRSTIAVNEALKIKPQGKNALRLKERLKVLPKIKLLLDKVRIAKIENNPEKEITILSDIIKLDSDRTDLVNRLQQLKINQKDQKFSNWINQGLKAIKTERVDKARDALAKAKAIDPTRPELKLLANKIATTVEDINKNLFLKTIDSLVVKDNWNQILELIMQTQGRYIEIPRVQRIGEMAAQLTKLESQLDKLLFQPERLEDQKINSYARKFIRDNQLLAANSARISHKIKKLGQYLETASHKILVSIYSDGKTEITIIGVGQIGKAKNKQISLKPGEYVFEGFRKGYRSKRVTLQIEPGEKTQKVTIICNERI